MVIDGATVITGSFNFTAAAQNHNAENLLVLDDPALATQYKANWERRRAVSDRYRGALPPATVVEAEWLGSSAPSRRQSGEGSSFAGLS